MKALTPIQATVLESIITRINLQYGKIQFAHIAEEMGVGYQAIHHHVVALILKGYLDNPERGVYIVNMDAQKRPSNLVFFTLGRWKGDRMIPADDYTGRVFPVSGGRANG